MKQRINKIMSNNYNKNLQYAELDILKQFINVCNKENLQYYVVGGTLLGAVRHKGFIPWDDDIDVSMPRKDFDRFLNVAQKHLPEPYFLQTYITDKNVRFNYAKIRNSQTTFIEQSVKKLDINHGVFIDIFPLDYYPVSKIKSFLVYSYIKSLMLIIRTKDCYVIDEMPFLKKTIKKFISVILKIIFPNSNILLNKINTLLKSVKNSHLIINYCGIWRKREVAPIQWFKEGTDLQFETITVKAPKEYDKYLTRIYGDYMKLPPKEKQISHNTAIVDLENPYTKYMNNETNK